MNYNSKVLTVFLLIGVLLFASGCSINDFKRKQPKSKPITLVVWNVFDDSDSWRGMTDSYNAMTKADDSRPTVKIDYYMRSFDGYEKYEQELNNAMAIDQGPDIFVVHNDWLEKYKDKIMPINEGTRTAKNYERRFVDVVANDFLINNGIYAIPLSVDTMALYYNVDLLKSVGIYDPPKTWDEFKDDLSRLTVLDANGNIIRAGAAIGTEKNINRSTDILALLMMQSGSSITDPAQRAAIFNIPQKDSEGRPYTAGEMALQFYTDFANPLKKTYTWNPMMDYSIDAFYQGRAAMMFNYSYHIPTIRSKAPKLNFSVAPMPQIAGTTQPVNVANYWAMTVSARSKHPKEAWDFLMYIANPEISKLYLTKTSKPAAQRDLVDWQEKGEDLNLGVFAKQAISAKSWFQADPLADESILSDAIKSIVLGKSTPKEASDLAASQISENMRKK